MRHYGSSVRPQRREGASSSQAFGKLRPRLVGAQGASKLIDREVTAGKEGLFEMKADLFVDQWDI